MKIISVVQPLLALPALSSVVSCVHRQQDRQPPPSAPPAAAHHSLDGGIIHAGPRQNQTRQVSLDSLDPVHIIKTVQIVLSSVRSWSGRWEEGRSDQTAVGPIKESLS